VDHPQPLVSQLKLDKGTRAPTTPTLFAHVSSRVSAQEDTEDCSSAKYPDVHALRG
jgi:hypothetical protein